ncbi:hypothetical protein RUM43_015052 [Polyplax serrata]|uniref:Uncharacterized protein n=1 Tax=Polyplax serrata TaxID=468196 RepID=A0AAN8NYN0_POLSC
MVCLINAEDIWPDNYDYSRLSYDIRSYQLLLSNASDKVYKGFIRQVDWNGRGTKSMISSQKPLQTSVYSTFGTNGLSSVMLGPSMSTMIWSSDKSLSAMDLLIGASTFVEGMSFDTNISVWTELGEHELRDIGIQGALGLNIFNIRPILEQPASAQTPLIVRTTFYEYNPTPGTKWSDNLLTNIDSIWPLNYGYGQSGMDVRVYKLLLANASNKVYKGFIKQIEWNGKGTKSFVSSQNPLQLSVQTTF